LFFLQFFRNQQGKNGQNAFEASWILAICLGRTFLIEGEMLKKAKNLENLRERCDCTSKFIMLPPCRS